MRSAPGPGEGTSAGGRLGDWWRLLRPRHWVKNGFVLAPILFSGRATDPATIVRVLLAFVAFCLVASAVYAFNDARDAQEDRAHPDKRHRPVAAGRIGSGVAIMAGAGMGAAGVGLAVAAGPATAGWVGAYLGLNILYTLALKHVVLLDVFAIASFFVLRLLAGAAAAGVAASIWLLLCGGLLALYLGFAKRRHELGVLGADSGGHRQVLRSYSVAFLDQVSAVLLAVTLVAYLMYALTSETAARVGSDALSYGIPFVLYGVFRYLYLVHQHDLGTPTETVLQDRPLLVAVGLWVLTNAWVLYR